MKQAERYALIVENAPDCTSYSQLAVAIGRNPIGSTITNLKKYCERHNIDVSHFKGQGWNRGGAALNKKSADEVLVLREKNSTRLKAKQLRRALTERGVPEKCAECGQGSEWNGKPLQLQIDHISGEYWDNRIENLRYLCPNCHTQTPTHSRASR